MAGRSEGIVMHELVVRDSLGFLVSRTARAKPFTLRDMDSVVKALGTVYPDQRFTLLARAR